LLTTVLVNVTFDDHGVAVAAEAATRAASATTATESFFKAPHPCHVTPLRVLNTKSVGLGDASLQSPDRAALRLRQLHR
jgi:hypothetical protein